MIGAHGLTRRIAAAGMAILAGACYSDVPLDLRPAIRVDANLVGEWTCTAPDDAGAEKVARLKVKAMDKYRYAVSWQDPGKKPEKYAAYASSVGGSILFNVQLWPPQDSRWWDHRWAFVAVDLSSGELRIRMVVDGVVRGTERSPEEVRESFTKAMDRSDILDQAMTVCRRRK